VPPASLRRGIQREKRKRYVGDIALSGLRAQVARWGATPPQQRGYCSLDFENTVHVAEFRKIPDAGGVLRDNRVSARTRGPRRSQVRWSLEHAQHPGQTDGRSRRIRQNGHLFSFNAPWGRSLVLPSQCGMVAAEFLPVISGSRGRSIGRGVMKRKTVALFLLLRSIPRRRSFPPTGSASVISRPRRRS